MFAVVAHRLLNLRSQFAGWGQHQHPNRPFALGGALRGLVGQTLQDRQREAGRLARASLCTGQKIATTENGGDCLLLNGGRLRIAEFSNGTHQGLGQAESRKTHGIPIGRIVDLPQSPVERLCSWHQSGRRNCYGGCLI